MKNETKQYVFESPDGGKTIYRREFGKYDKKELITPKKEKKNVKRNTKRSKS